MAAKAKKPNKRRAVLVGGVRTPFLRAFTDFTRLSSYELGTAAVAGLLEANPVKWDDIDGLIWGGDLFGDHREEVVWAPQDGKVYILFNTAPMENQPRITRLADRQYRNDLSRTAMQFNVVPTESGYLSVGQ